MLNGRAGFTHFCTFGIQLKNHEKRCGQASSGHDTQCPEKEATQPHQLCLREPRKGSAHVHAALPAEVGTTLIQKMRCLRREERRPEGAKSTLLYKYEEELQNTLFLNPIA